MSYSLWYTGSRRNLEVAQQPDAHGLRSFTLAFACEILGVW